MEPEIEITPAMTAAGIAALQDFNPNEDELEWIVAAIFRSMLAASRP